MTSYSMSYGELEKLPLEIRYKIYLYSEVWGEYLVGKTKRFGVAIRDDEVEDDELNSSITTSGGAASTVYHSYSHRIRCPGLLQLSKALTAEVEVVRFERSTFVYEIDVFTEQGAPPHLQIAFPNLIMSCVDHTKIQHVQLRITPPESKWENDSQLTELFDVEMRGLDMEIGLILSRLEQPKTLAVSIRPRVYDTTQSALDMLQTYTALEKSGQMNKFHSIELSMEATSFSQSMDVLDDEIAHAIARYRFDSLCNEIGNTCISSRVFRYDSFWGQSTSTARLVFNPGARTAASVNQKVERWHQLASEIKIFFNSPRMKEIGGMASWRALKRWQYITLGIVR
ncbi:uncharacterized protein KY384_003503 [Bacidia gigantensis]|uniref:uncharacterized protein n=1 Tax=Bacidia gigantensis TaxID=2732470 RepID=UPI001D03AB38|nr:uncharacterized protein KY384_003503 [Bacidia gigantensis]KAG8531867.1 hypothetical protein KY384_003503 [Bacidia gigantensis]